jgi:signal transduction histidine kinase
MKKVPAKIPSMARSLSRMLWLWFLIFSAAVGMAVWLHTDHEVHELLDDSLLAAAYVIQANLPNANAVVPALTQSAPAVIKPDIKPGTESPQQRFAWQWISPQGELKARSASAPNMAWRASAQLGYFDSGAWRVYGQRAVLVDGILYVAQSQAERHEASVEVALGAVLAVLAIGIVAQFWLHRRIYAELAPIAALSERMLQWNAGAFNQQQRPWGAPEREELVAVHTALDTLSTGLEAQIAHERAFSAHTSHALRTPLSGIDTQLAVALRETSAEQKNLRERLEKMRHSTQRMQRVVDSLLSLFRHGGEVQRESIDVDHLLSGVAVPHNIALHVSSQHTLDADPNLLSAALFNLIDNAVRYGAQTVRVSTPNKSTLVIADDGSGVSSERMIALQSELLAHDENASGTVGMGLWLAQRVAVAHRGKLRIESAEGSGFVVTLELSSQT